MIAVYRLQNSVSVTPAFLFAVMLWHLLLERAQKLTQESGLGYYDTCVLAKNNVLDKQYFSLAILKRITELVRDMWQLQIG